MIVLKCWCITELIHSYCCDNKNCYFVKIYCKCTSHIIIFWGKELLWQCLVYPLLVQFECVLSNQTENIMKQQELCCYRCDILCVHFCIWNNVLIVKACRTATILFSIYLMHSLSHGTSWIYLFLSTNQYETTTSAVAVAATTVKQYLWCPHLDYAPGLICSRHPNSMKQQQELLLLCM